MKKILSPILVLAIFFLIFLWLFSTRETTMDIALVLYASLPVFVAMVAFFVRRLIIKVK